MHSDQAQFRRNAASHPPRVLFAASRLEYRWPPAFPEKSAAQATSGPPWKGHRRALQLAFKTSGFRILGGRLPLKNPTTFSAAMQAIFVRVSSEAEARCGARTTLGRFSPAVIIGSFS